MKTRGDLTKEFDEWRGTAERVHDGGKLVGLVGQLESQLPASGAILLLAASDEALGVVAATAARRGDRTAWKRLDLHAPEIHVDGAEAVIVEVGEPPAAWQAIVKLRLPSASVVVIDPRRGST
jgi:hypothetical protein